MANAWISFTCNVLTKRMVQIYDQPACFLQHNLDLHWPQCNYFSERYFNPFPNKPWFLRVCSTSLLKTKWGKGEITYHEQFLLFPLCSLPIWRDFYYFHQITIDVCKTLSDWTSLKFIIWERVKD